MSQSVSDPMAGYEATVPHSKYRLRFSLLALFLFVTLICLALCVAGSAEAGSRDGIVRG